MDEQDRSGCSRMLFVTNLTGLVREPRHRRSQLGQAGVFLNPDMPHADGTVRGEAASNSAGGSSQRRAARLGMKVRIGCHTFRATGIAAYLEAGGRWRTLTPWRRMKARARQSATGNEITLDEVERIAI